MASLTEKVAIVTGASRGIGRAIAERLGRDGAKVVVTAAKTNVSFAAVGRTRRYCKRGCFSSQR